MKTRELDDLIAEALTDDEREFLAGLEEPSMMQQGLDLFRNQSRAMNIMVMIVMIAFTVLGVYSVVQFLTVEDVPAMLRWGAASFFFLSGVWAMKIWSWMEIEKYATLREIKRVELQVASLAHRLGGDR